MVTTFLSVLLISLAIFLQGYIRELGAICARKSRKLLNMEKLIPQNILGSIIHFLITFLLIFLAVYIANRVFPPKAIYS